MPTNLRGLYAITDTQRYQPWQPPIETLLATGVALLQYRAKSLPQAERYQQGQRLRTLCHQYQTPLIINDDLELALQLDADGIHLGQQDTPIDVARQALGPQAIIGITCHQHLELALEAEQHGADYVAFGRFFPSVTKPHAPPAPISLLGQARQQLSIPIVAIGGITLHNAPQLLAQGAQMLAVIHGLFGQADIATTATRFNDLFTAQQSAI